MGTRIKFRKRDTKKGFTTEQLMKMDRYMRTQPGWVLSYEENGWFSISTKKSFKADDTEVRIIETDVLIMFPSEGIEVTVIKEENQ